MHEGSKCKISEAYGTCKRIKNCPTAVESMIRTGTPELKRCGFVGMEELVCCPSVPLYLEEQTNRPFINNITKNLPVKVNIPINKQTYNVESNIQIPCEVVGHPKPEVRWYKDSIPVSTSDRVKFSDFNTLIILNVTKADSGHYVCEATNYHSTTSSNIDILIEGTSCSDKGLICSHIVKYELCAHKFFAKDCCRSCTETSLPTARPQSTYFYK
ncbi:papilin isoform X2 [Anoplophora glabripennis]|uniref:papilin isoform X2 n=1 Tax=Anoplophora glabripennis TaxID=217634 RepID=UPI00087388BA|nr:papilin isoform X2 [Anoplophora glabripennis]